MAGRVRFSGQNGSLGQCVEIDHGCDLRSEVCGLLVVSVSVGDPLVAGDPLGTAAGTPTLFAMWLGTHPLDPMSLSPRADTLETPPDPNARPKPESDQDDGWKGN
jgi:murein DD-endopeptidase MepM/ murein hydrolase activator NlpD